MIEDNELYPPVYPEDEVHTEGTRPYRSRYTKMEGCAGCLESLTDPFFPAHFAAEGCESGKRNHCTCDVCW